MNNLNNQIISRKELCDLIKTYTNKKVYVSSLNYKYYLQAFIHKSFSLQNSYNLDEDNYCHIMIDKYMLNNNERLEYLGDAQLYAIIAEYLYDKYPTKDEEFMTNLRIKLIKKDNLAFLSKKLLFDKYLLLSNHLDINNARINNLKLLENVFESFIGALYKDQGFELTKTFLINVLNTHLDFKKLIKIDDNYKSKLLVYFHARKWGNPEYFLISKTGTFNNIEFMTSLIIKKQNIVDTKIYNFLKKQTELLKPILLNNNHNINPEYFYVFLGKGNNLKTAEQDSSKHCLKKLEYI